MFQAQLVSLMMKTKKREESWIQKFIC